MHKIKKNANIYVAVIICVILVFGMAYCNMQASKGELSAGTYRLIAYGLSVESII